MAVRTRSRRALPTEPEPVRTCDTVPTETPARSATSLMVGIGELSHLPARRSGHALFVHLAGEQAGLHRRIHDDADVVLLAVRQNLGFDLGGDGGVGRLERSDGGDGADALHLAGVEIGEADVARLAFLLQFGER